MQQILIEQPLELCFERHRKYIKFILFTGHLRPWNEECKSKMRACVGQEPIPALWASIVVLGRNCNTLFYIKYSELN